MQACVKLVASRVGAGVQTVSGITDRDGQSFLGKIGFTINVGSYLDTLTYQNGVNVTATVWNHGADTGVLGAGASLGDIDQFFSKIACTGDLRRYSIGDYQPDIFFGGNWQGYGYVSAFRSGEVDITFPFNSRGGWGFMLVVLGGDDLGIDISQGMSSGVYVTNAPPVAVLAQSATYEMGASPVATTAASDSQITWGWDTKVGGRATAGALLIDLGGNARGALTDRMWSTIVGSSFVGAPFVSSWDSLSYTVDDGYIAGCNKFAFSGVSANAVSVPLRTTPGQQVIDLGIAARWVKIVAIGTVESATPDVSQAQLSVGWADGTRQGCAWFGETASGSPITGARLLSQGTVVQISAAAAGGSTTFSAVASVTDIDVVTGQLTLDVTAANGTAYQLLIFALGDALPPVSGVLATQLPVLAAYDYATMAPLMRDGGRRWRTPPPRRTL